MYNKDKNTMKLKCIIICCLVSLFAFDAQAQTDVETSDIQSDLSFFNDPLATQLNKKVTKKKILKMKSAELKTLAGALLDKTYDTDYRVATYMAYPDPNTLGKQLHIGSGYSKYENMTGVVLTKGKHLVLVEGIAEGNDRIKLLIPNWERRAPEGIEPTKDPNGWGVAKKEFTLRNGINIIDNQDWDGLSYIYYYSETPESENPVKIHFVNGKVNGYFDVAKHNDTDWDRLIDGACYPVLDARGKYIQVAYPVEALKQYASGRGVELIGNYDRMILLQHKFMGLEKYGRALNNRILARVNYNYYMFRDGDGVAYMGTKPGNAMPLVVDPARVIKDDPCWGFNHEVGHVHQLRPYLNWGGLGEVSNNIVTMYVTTTLGNKSRLAESGAYQKGRDSIIIKQKSFLQYGDVICRLVPFWQLHLYSAKYGDGDFYPDLQEAFRTQPPVAGRAQDQNVAELQLNFVEKACLVAKTDFTDFFEKWGFFYVGTIQMNDYGKYTYDMSKEMVDACKKRIGAMNLQKPATDLTLLEDEPVL